MKLLATTIYLFILIGVCTPIPRAKREIYSDRNYLALSSQILATNLLKDNIDIDGNHVHSPLGISTVLAILAEGSRGETYQEFISALGFPADKKDLRSSAKAVLQNFNAKDVTITPSFKTWFYIYKNNTAKEDYKQILRDYYFAEVKDIERSDYDWNDPKTNVQSNNSNSKDIIDFETLKKSEVFDDSLAIPINTDDIDDKKEASKFDKVVDDKQYVEVPVIKEEIAKEKERENVQHLIGINDEEVNDEDNETIRDVEKLEVLKKEIESIRPVESSEPEKISIPLKKLDDLEIMQTLESQFSSKRLNGARTLFSKDDVTSALSANSIVGDESGGLTKMLLFNGLYYRGNWLHPFLQLRNGPEDVFHLNNNEAMPAIMMKSLGKFKTADLVELNSEAIEFPYEDTRYSLLVVLPNEKEGLHDLIEKLQPRDIASIRSRLSESSVSVCLPKFNIDSTSRSEIMLKSLGLKKLFSADEADLGDLTDTEKLHIDEIVQHVNIRVDEGASSKATLTGTATAKNNLSSDRNIVIDRPFLYFVINEENNFVIVVGKIMSPDFVEDSEF